MYKGCNLLQALYNYAYKSLFTRLYTTMQSCYKQTCSPILPLVLTFVVLTVAQIGLKYTSE